MIAGSQSIFRRRFPGSLIDPPFTIGYIPDYSRNCLRWT
jgi:hypothetical protein